MPSSSAAVVDHPLDRIGRLGPPGAAIGPGRGGVGEHPRHMGVDRGRPIGAGERAEIVGRGMGAEQGQVGAEIGGRADPEPEELAVPGKRQLGAGDVVARLVVDHEPLGPVAGPLDRPAEHLRGMEAERVFAIGTGPHPERAAHVVADDAQIAFRHLEDRGSGRHAHPVRTLGSGIEGVAPGEWVEFADAGARLHRGDGDAGDDEVEPGDVVGLGEGVLDRVPVALLEDEADIVGRLRPDRGGAGGQGIRGGGDRGKRLVTDLDQLGRVARPVMGPGDDESDIVADQPHPVLAERQVRRGEHRRAVGLVARHRAGNAAEPRRLDIGMGIDREHAGGGLGGGGVDRADPGMGVRRAQHVAIGLAGPVEVVAVAPAAAQQARVFPTRHALADTELGHGTLPTRSPAESLPGRR